MSRMTTSLRTGTLRVGRTRWRGKSDMRPQPFDQRRSDAPHALERLERSERSVLRAILDDPCSQSRSDAWQLVECCDVGDVDIDRRYDHRCARSVTLSRRIRDARLRRAHSAPARTTRRDRRVHASDLVGERGARVGGDRGLLHDTAGANADAERRHRRQKEERLALRWSGHRRTLRARRSAAASARGGAHENRPPVHSPVGPPTPRHRNVSTVYQSVTAYMVAPACPRYARHDLRRP